MPLRAGERAKNVNSATAPTITYSFRAHRTLSACSAGSGFPLQSRE
ncbi:MAG: hypothetical protein LBQ31_03270 [Bacteroidales bacterium]|nr:hypothetical protein [Bacteroidales bacterium]